MNGSAVQTAPGIGALGGEALREVIGHIRDGVLVVDRHGKVLLANQAAERMLRPLGDGLVGTEFCDPTAIEDGAELDIAATGIVAEMRVCRMNLEGRPAQVITLRDVTGRRPDAAEHALVKAWLEQAERVIGFGCSEYDLRSRHIGYSLGMSRVVGWDIGEDREIRNHPRSVAELVHPDDRERFLRVFDAIEAGAVQAEVEHRIVRPDGEVRTVHGFVEPVAGADGTPVTLRSVVWDVTEQRRAEEASRESVRLLEAIADNSPARIFVKDAQGRFLFANRSFQRLSGRSQDELATMTVYDLLPREVADKMAAQDARVLAEGAVLTSESNIELSEGVAEIWLMVRFPIRDDEGRPAMVGLVALDVTEQRRLEESSRESVRLLEAIADNTPAAINVKDREGHFVFGNRRHLEVTGRTREELSSITDYDFMPREVADRLAVDDARVLAEGVVEFDEGTIPVPAGTMTTWLVVRFPIPDDEGRPAMVGMVGLDVTEQRRLEEASRENARLLEAIADNTPAAINVKDKEGHFVFGNRRHLEVTGRTREELPSLTDYDFMPREVADRLAVEDAQVLAEGAVRVDEDTFPVPAGTMTTWTGVRFPIPDDEGRPAMVGMVALDVTEQRRAVEALRKSEERFRLLADRSKDMIFLVKLTPTPRVEYVSPAVQAVLGHTADEMTGDLEEVLSRLDPDIREPVGASLRSPDPRPKVFRHVRPDGSVAWVEQQTVPIHDAHGQLVAVEGTVRDVTKRVVAEQERLTAERRARQAERLESLGQLAGGIAHDFNNLLAVILGTAQLLADDLDTGDPRLKDVRQIVAASERGADLTRQLLIFSRREAGQSEVIDLNEAITNIGEMVHRTIGEDIEFQVHLQPGVPPVSINHARLEQVVLNLVVNARHAMPTGGSLTIETADVTIGETTAESIPSGRYALLTVADTGTGISPEIAQHVFEPFFTTREPGQGTGLGLATVHGIITQADGHITIDTNPGQGTTFRIHLPAATRQPVPAAHTAGAPAPPGHGETILLVEDEQPVRDVIERTLTRNNYRVLTAHDPQQALALSGDPTVTIDAMLTDLIMPGMSGTRLAQHIHATTRPDLPVLFMTGYSDRGMRPTDGDMPPPDVITLPKPFTADALLDRLHQTLRRVARQ